MSELTIKKGQLSSHSLQMALLHLRWQQIRQLELQPDSFQPHEPSTPSAHAQHRHEKIFTAA